MVKRASRGKGRNFVKVGTVKIFYYGATDGRTIVDPRKYGRKLLTRSDKAEALREATRIAIEINQGGVEVTAFTPNDRAIYAQVCVEASRRGVDPSTAIVEWGQVTDELKASNLAHSLADVVRAGFKALTRPVFTTPQVVGELLAIKAGEDHDGRHARDFRHILRDFSVAFPGDIARITPEEIEAWLANRKRPDGKPLSSKRRNHIHAIVIALFKFARERERLPDLITAAQKVKRRKVNRSEIDYYTPEEMIAFLGHVEEDWLPWPLLVGFGGMRVEEVALSKHSAERKDCLRWEGFDWTEKEIVVREAVAKVGRSRRIPIQPNLYAWLAPWRDRKATGPVVPKGDRRSQLDIYRARLQREMRVHARSHDGVTPRLINPPQNVFRHSFGSYRMAMIKNAQQVSNEMGDSPAIVHRNYDNPRPKSQAQAWWAIFPEDAIRTSQLILRFDVGAASKVG